MDALRLAQVAALHLSVSLPSLFAAMSLIEPPLTRSEFSGAVQAVALRLRRAPAV